MGYIRRICNAIRGPSLLTCLRLYITRVLPIILYACGAWYIPIRSQFAIDEKRICTLECAHSKNLRVISGALIRAPATLLRKELYMLRIEFLLLRSSMVHSAKCIPTENSSRLDAQRRDIASWEKPVSELESSHPYYALDARAISYLICVGYPTLAQVQSPNGIRYLAKKLKKDLNGHLHKLMSDEWTRYKNRSRQETDFESPVALVEDWGPHSREYYRGLPRAQSSILLQCRTGVIQLNARLDSITTKVTP